MAAACQARDIRWAQAETEARLLPLAVERDGLSEHEALATIRSAYTRAARDVPHGAIPGGPYAPPKITARIEPPVPKKVFEIKPDFTLPPGIADSAQTLLARMFKSGENIMIARGVIPYGETKERPSTEPDEQRVYERDLLIRIINDCEGDAAKIFGAESRGVFFCINPLSKETSRRLIENISDFRHCLIEFDLKPKEEQYQMILQSNIPCAAIVDSGHVSIHAETLTGARSLEEFKERVCAYMEFFHDHGVDPATKDPTRFSRLPGVSRSDYDKGQQKLLALDVGSNSYEEWKSGLATLGSELPELMAIADLLAFVVAEDPDKLIGANRFLGRGTSFLLSGHSGIGKSSLGLQMHACFAVGRSFLPDEAGKGGLVAVRPIKTLIIQSENDRGDMAETLQGIVKALAFSPGEIERLKLNLQIRRDTSHTGPEFIQMMTNLWQLFKADVVLIDPLFASVGADITKAEVIGDFFRKRLNTFMIVTKAIVTFMHHIPKPSMDKSMKYQGHDMIYSGAGSAELTNWARATATLQPNVALPGVFQLIFGKRKDRTGICDDEGKPTDCLELQHGSDGIYWKRLDKGLREELESAVATAKAEARARKKKPTAKQKAQLAQFASWIKDNPAASQNAVVIRGSELLDVTEPTMRNRLKEMITDGQIEEIDTGIKAGRATTKNYVWKGSEEGM